MFMTETAAVKLHGLRPFLVARYAVSGYYSRVMDVETFPEEQNSFNA